MTNISVKAGPFSPSPLVLCTVEDGIATVTVNNQPANQLSTHAVAQLKHIFQELPRWREVQVVILTGAGGHSFCSGADIKEIAAFDDVDGVEYFRELGRVYRLIEELDQPVIAAINGFAMGAGFELALCADIRIADDLAKFGASGVNIGLVYCTQRLPRLISRGKAKELLYTGRTFSATEGETLGLIDRVVPAGTCLEEAKLMAKGIMKRAPLAVQGVKKAINRGMEMSLADGLSLELDFLKHIFTTEDQKEGANSFLEKRKPVFKGK